MQIRACIFVWLRTFAEDPDYQELRQRVLDNLNGLTVSLKEINEDEIIDQVQFSVRAPTPDEVQEIDSRRLGGDRYVCIEVCSSDYNLNKLKADIQYSDERDVSDAEREDIAYHFLAWSLRSFLDKFIVLMSMCYFGCLNALWGIRYVADSMFDSSGGCGSWIANAYLENEYVQKPLPARVGIDEALQWSKSCRGFWYGVAETRLEKAVACLTHVFSAYGERTDSFSNLLWALSGLEALYCDSEAGIAYQIRRRAPLLVSRYHFDSLDRAISKGYGFRSRLFHGDVPIRSKLIEDDVGLDDRHYEFQAERHSSFFLLLLTCSILACVEDGRSDVTFQETLG